MEPNIKLQTKIWTSNFSLIFPFDKEGQTLLFNISAPLFITRYV